MQSNSIGTNDDNLLGELLIERCHSTTSERHFLLAFPRLVLLSQFIGGHRIFLCAIFLREDRPYCRVKRFRNENVRPIGGRRIQRKYFIRELRWGFQCSVGDCCVGDFNAW